MLSRQYRMRFVSGAAFLALLHLALALVPAPVSIRGTAKYGVSPSPFHPAVAIDWWLPNDANYGHQWQNASVLHLNLDSAPLRALLKGLGATSSGSADLLLVRATLSARVFLQSFARNEKIMCCFEFDRFNRVRF